MEQQKETIKKALEEPEVEIISLDNDDVISTSDSYNKTRWFRLRP